MVLEKIIYLINIYTIKDKLISKINVIIYVNIFLIAITLLIFHLFNLDLPIQELLYVNSNWLIDRYNQELKVLFYIAPKQLLTGFATIIIMLNLFLITKRGDSKYNFSRKILFYIFISMLFSILSISILKQMTNMYCPDSLKIFGGDKPFIKLFEEFPESFNAPKRGKCFPAGHASAGFSLVCIAFILRNKKYAYSMLVSSLVLGWLMGGYQIAKGSHYLSDTVITMILSFFFASVFYKLILLKR